MSHTQPVPASAFEEMTQEEQIVYVETNLEQILANLYADETIPYWHREILGDGLTRFRSQTENAIPWEEVKEELEREFRQR
jgi:hypothetical protein